MATRPVSHPSLGAACADAHAHLCMLEDPVGALVNAALARVDTILTIVYPSDPDELRTTELMPEWRAQARGRLRASGLEAPEVRLAVGCHPHEASTWDVEASELIRGLLGCSGAVAVGETGLDFHYDHSPRDVQRRVFREHLLLAHELGKPVVVHLREAHEEGLAILREEGVPEAGAIIHCFSEGPDLAERFLELGCLISFAGTATFKKADPIREAARIVPSDSILVETDCPFLAPEPYRGRKNEPAFVTHVAARLAAARGERPATFAARTRANARAVFGFDSDVASQTPRSDTSTP